MEKFKKEQLSHDDASEEAQELQKRLRENYPEKKELSTDDYDIESDILDVERAQAEEIAEITETELSQEVIEAIMNKVQDINKPGTGVHFLTRSLTGGQSDKELLPNILKFGLLGRATPKSKQTPEDWISSVRKRMGAVVFFNIIGRDLDKVRNSVWLSRTGTLGKDLIVGLIFNTDRLKEHQTIKGYAVDYYFGQRKNLEYKPNTFGPNINSENEQYFNNEEGDNPRPPTSDDGYAATFRINPNSFNGVVLNFYRKQTEDEIEERIWREMRKRGLKPSEENYQIVSSWHFGDYLIEDKDPENIRKKTEEFVNNLVKSCNGRYDRLLPVYDIRGNLLWPSQISYDRVKRISKKKRP